MNDENKTPEPATPVQPKQEDDPNIIGRMTDDEMASWARMKNDANGIIMELGNMVVRTVRGVRQLDALDESLRSMIQGSIKRFGLPDDARCQLLQDGRIRVLANVQPTQQAVPEPAKDQEKTEPKEDPAVAAAKALAAQAKAAKETEAKAKESTAEPPN